MYRAILIPVLLLLLSVPVFGQTRPAPPSPPPPAPGGTIRPRLSDSATGYVDNAIVGRQIRFRFDAGYGIDSPDRAEFFYAKCGCFRFLPSDDPRFDPNAPGPGSPGDVETNLNYQEFRLDTEFPVHDRVSLTAEIPVRSIDPKVIDRASGIGDIRVGFKAAAFASEDLYLTAQLRTYIPSGNARRGLGTNHASLEPALLYHQKFAGQRTALAGQLGLWHPIKGSAGVPTSSPDRFSGNVLIYGFGGSYDAVDTPRLRIAPVVEFVGWRVLGGFQTTNGPLRADGTHIVNIKIGARLDTGGPGSFYAGYGHALTNARWYEDVVRVEYRIAF